MLIGYWTETRTNVKIFPYIMVIHDLVSDELHQKFIHTCAPQLNLFFEILNGRSIVVHDLKELKFGTKIGLWKLSPCTGLQRVCQTLPGFETDTFWDVWKSVFWALEDLAKVSCKRCVQELYSRTLAWDRGSVYLTRKKAPIWLEPVNPIKRVGDVSFTIELQS